VVVPLLLAEDLVATLPGDAGPHAVLAGVSLALQSGEIVDVRGPSGSGKTTMLRALARLLPGVSSARLALDGEPAEKVAPALWRARVALLPQRPAIVPGTVRDNLALPWTLRVRAGDSAPADAELAKALARVHLDVDLERDAARLSVGQAARVALLRVVLTRPRVLLLDEPDASLDDASADEVRAMTQEFAAAGGGVVRVRHHRGDGAASRVLSLAGGTLTEEPS
jgi:putative ABC transport system ATP-binding protein